MSLFLIIALACGATAFFMATLAFMYFGGAALKHLFSRRLQIGRRYLSLAAIALACLGVCVLLFKSEPVVWPWSPWHIPVYLVVILVCKRAFMKAKLLKQAQSSNAGDQEAAQ